MTHEQLKQKALKRGEVRREYESLDVEFELLRQMLGARKKAGLSQAQVAERMGTYPPAVARLESSLQSRAHSPSLSTLEKYARAVGCQLRVKLVAG